jgi:hypothetical protein
MPPSEKARERITLIDERLARLRAERERLVARTNRVERKRDTRRKIVLGGTVLAALDRDGMPALRTQADMIRWLDAHLERPQDRRVFDLPARPGRLDLTS